MSGMSVMQKIFFITAWVVAGTGALALILEAIALRGNGLVATGAALDILFLGITGCFTLLYLSGWFTHSLILFFMAWVVAGVALLSLILTSAANLAATYIVGTIFWHIGLGGFCTLLLLHLSGKFGKD